MNRQEAMDGDHQRLGQAIKRHREAANLTQAILAEMAGLLQGQLSNWERAARSIPSIDDLAAIERALDIPLGTLLVEAGYVTLPTTTGQTIAMDPALEPSRREDVIDFYDAQVRKSSAGGLEGRSTAERTSPTLANRRRKSANS